MGYKDFGYMHALYGDLFLFDDGIVSLFMTLIFFVSVSESACGKCYVINMSVHIDEEAYRVRDLVRGLFHKDNCDHYMKTVTRYKVCALPFIIFYPMC